jgi:hypothetical protein
MWTRSPTFGLCFRFQAFLDPWEEAGVVSKERHHAVFKADNDCLFLIVGFGRVGEIGVVPKDVVDFMEKDAYGVVRGDEVLSPEIDNVVLEVSLSTFVNLVVRYCVEDNSPVVSAYLDLPWKGTE